jgi:hypothetical protein
MQGPNALLLSCIWIFLMYPCSNKKTRKKNYKKKSKWDKLKLVKSLLSKLVQDKVTKKTHLTGIQTTPAIHTVSKHAIN